MSIQKMFLLCIGPSYKSPNEKFECRYKNEDCRAGEITNETLLLYSGILTPD